MSATSLVLSIYFINAASSCSYYAQISPIPPFDEVARIPIGVCSGNHYFHSKIAQESEMYLCSHDNSHIIKYKYLKSSKCSGDYEKSIATRNPSDFVCDGDETCPYIVIKVHNQDSTKNDWRRWYSSTFVVNNCQIDRSKDGTVNGIMYTCQDNTGYAINQFDNPQCFGIPTNVDLIAADQEFDEDKNSLHEIYCNQPDPTSAIIAIPDDGEEGQTMSDNSDTEDEWIIYGPEAKASIMPAIETAVCLSGRLNGQHREIADNMVSYCFNGYDVFGKPTYKGDYAEIKWTEKAGMYGAAYGIFLINDEWPIAYCFSDSPNIEACTKHWYVDHGTTARYYVDMTMETNECECNRKYKDEDYQQDYGDDDDLGGVFWDDRKDGSYRYNVNGIGMFIEFIVWYIYFC